MVSTGMHGWHLRMHAMRQGKEGRPSPSRVMTGTEQQHPNRWKPQRLSPGLTWAAAERQTPAAAGVDSACKSGEAKQVNRLATTQRMEPR